MDSLLSKLENPVLGLPRFAKRSIVIFVDISLCIFAVWLAYFLRIGEFVTLSGDAFWAVGLSVFLAIPIFFGYGLYLAIFRYTGWPALLAVARAVLVYGVIYASVFMAFGVAGVPRTVGIIQPLLLLFLIGASRAFARIWLGDRYRSILKKVALPKALIYGAGRGGRQLAAAMGNSHVLQIVGFLDDDESLHGHAVNGLRVYNPGDLSKLVSSQKIKQVLLAIPSLNRRRRNEILASIRRDHVSVRTLPSLSEIAQGNVSVSDLRELDLDDLLGRDAVAPDTLLLEKNICNKTVLVTGAGGSIGSELCRQIQAIQPRKLILIDHSEFALYAVHQELVKKLDETFVSLVPVLANVQDQQRMNEIMSIWRPDTVYHAAAYKHVPLVEHNPSEGIKNNLFGTLSMAQAAARNGVADFVLISTDKAVRPTNIMGASKRMAEMVLQALAVNNPITKYTIVRFGNVLGSSGSVVPKFRQQIDSGGPITLTDPEVTRYFMTIPEAAQLVIQAGAMASGGEVFLLDMGQPVKIFNLATRMIELSGLSLKNKLHPDGDIEIETIGLRPGEKLHEELLIGDDPQPTSHPLIMKAHESFIPWLELHDFLNDIDSALIVNDVARLKTIMCKLVAGYTPTEEIVDWMSVEKNKNDARTSRTYDLRTGVEL